MEELDRFDCRYFPMIPIEYCKILDNPMYSKYLHPKIYQTEAEVEGSDGVDGVAVFAVEVVEFDSIRSIVLLHVLALLVEELILLWFVKTTSRLELNFVTLILLEEEIKVLLLWMTAVESEADLPETMLILDIHS